MLRELPLQTRSWDQSHTLRTTLFRESDNFNMLGSKNMQSYNSYSFFYKFTIIHLSPHSQLHCDKINAHLVISHDAHDWMMKGCGLVPLDEVVRCEGQAKSLQRGREQVL